MTADFALLLRATTGFLISEGFTFFAKLVVIE
jgi:hypothetical protein